MGIQRLQFPDSVQLLHRGQVDVFREHANHAGQGKPNVVAILPAADNAENYERFVYILWECAKY